MSNNLHVAVLAGGISDERVVSLRSGEAVAAALNEAGYGAKLVDLTSEDSGALGLDTFDVVFPVLHGKTGEDGTIQLQLEAKNIPYVGTDSAASALCFDKQRYRDFLDSHSLPIAPGASVTENDFWSSQLITKPFVLKPFDGGSSIDTIIAHDPGSVSRETITDIFSRHQSMLLEELIEGVEITVGVLGTQALPIVEIIPPEGKEFDYENKYNGATQELCPPKNLSADVQQRAQQLAVQIHQLTGCRHYSRTDMIVRLDGSLVVLETNTLPGMTAQSLFPKSAAAAGINMPQLCDQLVQMAITA
jgi:D-alanine-D-alanine ligase